MNAMNKFSEMLAYISPVRKWQFSGVFLLMLFSSLLEVMSIGAVIPFLAALTAPEKVMEGHFGGWVAGVLGVSAPEQILLPMTVIFCVTALVAGGLRVGVLWSLTWLSHLIGADLSKDVYRKTLYQPYLTHVQRNSSEVVSGIYVKINAVIHSILVPVLTIVSSALSFFAIIFGLILIDAAVAIVALGTMGGVYAAVMLSVKKSLSRNGEKINNNSSKVIKTLHEGLGGIRDILIDGSQEVYCNIYQAADWPLRKAQAENQIYTGLPRYIVESLGIVVIAIVAYWVTLGSGGIAGAIPVLGALAIGAQRLLPILQQLYAAWVAIHGEWALFMDVLQLLGQKLPEYAAVKEVKKISFSQSIAVEDLFFRYADHGEWVLKGVSFEISRGMHVGFIGTTGSGKSTLVDVLMGLLMPEEGRVLVDGVLLSPENCRGWQTLIAHVPQVIFLSDGTIRENIAFGVPPEEIDDERIELVAQQAMLADTVKSWKDQYQTLVGERGVRLSGGQRQRIGIARALYKKADILVFDEATSALDNETEENVIKEIVGKLEGVTVLMVAHRLTTLKSCDLIVKLEAGAVKEVGSYSEVIGG